MTFSKTLLLTGTILSAAFATQAQAQTSASPYTSATRYDAVGRVTGTISPDPDGSGPLPFRAVRNTYDSAGRLITLETGTLSAWQSEAVAPASWSGFTVHSQVDTVYDSQSRKTRATVSAGGTAYAITQTSYDAVGRPDCTATRMNPAAFGALPASACTLGTEGTFGPDRITRTVHNAAGEVTQEQVAVGTAEQATDATFTYDLNGQRSSLTDANGNRAEMRYDGHGRQSRWVFPSASAAGQVNEQDYEDYGYDANGNRTSVRNRAGETIGFTFDALNRVTFKNLPGAEPDVTYVYDLLDRMTGASQPGQALTFSWDGFGRQLTQTGPIGTINSVYDAEGRRTSLSYPDGFVATYSHLVTGEVATIGQSGVGTLITFGYDSQGRRTSITRLNGTGTSYGYDAISRLSSLSHDLSGTNRDVTFGYVYNPVSQIISRTSSNDAYSPTLANANVADTHNGLNQLTVIGASNVTHDARGNTTNDPSNGQYYGYSSENLLATTGVSGVWNGTLTYDPLARLYDSGAGGRTRVLHDGQRRIAEYSETGAQRQRFIFGPGIDEPLLEYGGAGLATRAFLHADERGSIIGASNDSGTSTAIAAYDDYGRPLSFASRFGYTGQPYETVSALQYSRARFYNPRLGRFPQVDPIGYEDQINLYVSFGNDPINVLDPTGTSGCISRIEGVNLCSGISGIAFEQGRLLADTDTQSRAQPGGPIIPAQRCLRGCHDIETSPDDRYTTEAENAALAWEALLTAATLLPGGAAIRAATIGQRVANSVITSSGTLRTTRTVADQLNRSRSYIPVSAIRDTIRYGSRVRDPQRASGAYQYTVSASRLFRSARGVDRGSAGFLEVIVDESTNTIMHVLYRSTSRWSIRP